MLVSLVSALPPSFQPALSHIASSETVKMFLPTDKRSQRGGKKEGVEEEGISGGVAELNIYREIRVWG